MNSSYRIIFYVSGHGFGHTSRAIAVIDALLHAHPEAQIVVKTAAPLRLFAHTLGSRCELINLQCDAGMVQTDSLNVDTAGSIRQAVRFQTQVSRLAQSEARYLSATGARMVVGDIPPLSVAAAHLAGVPSVIIGNFTWDWIYASCGEEGGELAREIRRMYEDASLALRLPMAGGFAAVDALTRDIPFIARRSSRTQDEVRSALGLPPRRSGKPLVLMSFGGHGVAGFDTAAVARLKDYTIATTDLTLRQNGNAQAHGLLFISEQQVRVKCLLYEDLVRGADIVATKPGYGIITEAIANDAALLYTSRGDFVEYHVLVKEMPRYLRAQFIDQSDLLNGNWESALEKLMNQPAPPETPPLNGAKVAAEEILALKKDTA